MSNSFFQLLFYFVNIKAKYERLRNDEERSKSSVSLGVGSIVNSVIWTAVIVLSIWGFSFFFDFLDSSFIIGIVMVILCAAVALISLVYLVFGSLMYFIYQLKLNKHPIGYVAIAIWVLCIAGGIVLTLFLVGAF